MGRKPKDGKEKSERELQDAYVAKTKHAIHRIDDWADKLMNYAESKKYSLTDAQREKMLTHLADTITAVADAYTETPEVVEKGFDF